MTDSADPKPAEEPKAEEPKAEEPKAEEPKAEEPKAEEPKAEEPKVEEPKAEEPKVEEPKAEEPKAEEPEAAAPSLPRDDVEELTPAEVAFSVEELQAEVDRRRQELNGMPDGPRPAAPRGSYKRRKVPLVDLPFQLSYVGIYVATITLLAVGFIALNFMFKAMYDRALQIQQHASRVTDADPDLLMLGLVNFTFVMLLVIGMAVYAIIQSHRVAGPAYRFKKALRQMHRRDYDWHLILRQKDFMHDLAEQINTLNNALKAKDVVIADAAYRLTELTRDSQNGVSDQLQELATDLSDVLLPIPEAEPAAVAS